VNSFTGDAVGIYPENCGEDVDEVIKLAGWKATQLVDVPVHAYQPVIGTEAESHPSHLRLLLIHILTIPWPTFSKIPKIFPTVFLSFVTCDFLRKIPIQILDAVLTLSKSGIALS